VLIQQIKATTERQSMSTSQTWWQQNAISAGGWPAE
jgi:hypothetical protein